MFLYGLDIDLDQRFEYKRRIPACEAMLLEEPLIDKQERDLLCALLLYLIAVVAHLPKGYVPLGLEDVVGPLHEFPPDEGGGFELELPLPGKQLLQVKLSYHKSNISCRII